MEATETNKQEKPGLARALYTILYLVIGRFISIALFVVAVTQYIYSWLTGEANEKILHFSANLAEYTKQLVSYVSFNTDEKPWPVGDWPSV